MSIVSRTVGARRRQSRMLALMGTALGSTLALPGVAQAQNVASSGTTDYSLTRTDAINGGPRTVDITTSGGNITLDLATVTTANSTNTQGLAIGANNTGPGSVGIRTSGATATGTGLTYAVDARATTGPITINNTGTVDASGNNGDRAIYAASAGGDITINSNVANGQQRGISTNPNPAGAGSFGTTGTTTITSTTATANGTGQINAILGQGNRVVINSGTASNTNTAGNQGTAIFVNAGAGGVLVNAGTTNAFGQDQAAIQIFSEGAVDLTSGTVRTTQNSDGLSVASGTNVVVRSTAITTEGPGGARGIVLGANAGGGGFNSGPNGFAYTSATITSGSISTVGTTAFGIYVTPNGAGTTTINSGTVTTTGTGSAGIYVSPIGTGTSSGAITITSDTINSRNAGIVVGNGNTNLAGNTGTNTGAVTITSNTLTATRIGIDAGGAQATVTSTDLTAGGMGIVAFGTGSKTITSGAIRTTAASSQAITAQSTDGGAVAVKSTTIAGFGSGITAGNGAVNVPGGNVTIDSGSIALSTTASNNVNSLAGLGINATAGGTSATALKITSGSVVYTGTGNTVGITAQQTSTGGGTLDITSGTVTTTGNGGYGILGYTSGAAITINSTGNVTTVGTTRAAGGSTALANQRYADGIDAISQNGAVSVTNGGTISTAGTMARGIDVEAGRSIVTFGTAATTASTAALSVTNTGTLQTAGVNSNAINILGDAGTITLTNGGTVGTRSDNSVGVRLSAGTGNATIANTGAITTAGQNAYGIALTPTSGTTTITGAGSITTTGAAAHGIYLTPGATANTGATSITTGAISVGGANAIGIFANNAAGAVTINASEILATGTGGSGVVVIPTSGSTAPVNVQVGTLRVTGAAPAQAAINLSSNGFTGPITVGVVDSVSTGSTVDARSVGAVAITSGTARVAGGTSDGLIAISSAGSATVNSTDLAVTNGRGIFAQGPTSVNVTSGTLAVTGTNVDYAILAQTSQGTNAGVINVASTAVTTQTGGINAFGSAAVLNVDSGTIAITGADAGTSVAIAATGSSVNITSGTITNSGTGNRIGINAQALQSNTAGQTLPDAVTVRSGTISTVGNGAYGITAQSGSGLVTVNNTGAITTTGGTRMAGNQLRYSAGIIGTSTSGNIAVTSNAITTSGANADGIRLEANSGQVTYQTGLASVAGTIAVTSTGAINTGGDNAAGIRVLAGGSATTLNLTGAIKTAGANAYGVFVQSGTGAITGTFGNIATTGAGADAVRLLSDSGAITANVAGALSSAGGVGLFIDPPSTVTVNIAAGASVTGLTALNVTGTANTLTNLGTLTGTNGAAIIAAGATTLVNGGAISGANGTAVQLGATNDSVTLSTGSSVTGRIVGGGGTDAATLRGTSNTAVATQTVAGFTGFDSLTVQSGYWTGAATNSSAFNTATIASGATLEVANGATGITGVTAPSIVDNGTLVVRSNAASAGSTFGTGIVSGTGSVLLTGAGTVRLDGTNSIATSGTTTIDGGTVALITGTQGGALATTALGTVIVGNGGTTGAVTGTLVNNGTLFVNRSNDYVFTAALSGAGNFVKQGAGLLTFGTNYAFTGTTTIEAGSIRLSTPVAANTEIDLRGAGRLDLSGTTQQIAELAGNSSAASINIAGGSLTVNQATTTSFAGSLVGAGTLTKTGTGSLNLTGTNTYTGATTVNGGRLAVNGSIVSPVTVNAGGTLGGTGTVANVTIASGGTYAPGNSIGTQTVNGNVAFAAGSIYAVEVNAAGASDRINASGTATISGGTVQVLAEAGTYAQLTNYTILTAAGGVSGRFAGVTSNFAYLSPLLSYGANAVSLTLARNDIAFGAMATSPNQRSVAGAIAARGLGDTVYNAILFQSTGTASSSFAQLSGELHASLPSELTDNGRRIRSAVLSHQAPDDGFGIWGQGLQSFANSRSGAAQVDANRTGGIGGIDYAVNGVRVGINGGYLDDQVRIPTLASRAHVETTFAGASAGWNQGRIAVQVGASYAWHDIDTNRTLTVAGLAGTLTASPHANSAQLFAEAGYALTDGMVAVTPFVRNAYTWTRVKAFAESGTAAALSVARDRRDTDLASAGVRIGGTAPITQTVTFLPRIEIAYQRGFGDLDGTSIARIGGTGPAFAITGAKLGKDALTIDTGFDILVGSRFSIGAGGFASTSHSWSDYGAKGSIGFRF